MHDSVANFFVPIGGDSEGNERVNTCSAFIVGNG
jgi:hypothetical protein